MRPYTFTSKIWLYPGNAAWHFVTVPKDMSEQVTKKYKHMKRGFGSLKVVATIGKTSWDTSIFPDSRSGTYLLPIKLAVRKKEGLAMEDMVTVALSVR
jgi:hypothetical protein